MGWPPALLALVLGCRSDAGPQTVVYYPAKIAVSGRAFRRPTLGTWCAACGYVFVNARKAT